jgi:hypothetical protein
MEKSKSLDHIGVGSPDPPVCSKWLYGLLYPGSQLRNMVHFIISLSEVEYFVSIYVKLDHTD